jgi:hypothetical protein
VVYSHAMAQDKELRQSGITWRPGAENQLQCRNGVWYLCTYRGKEGSVEAQKLPKRVAKSLLEGGMSFGD